jgi:thioesterase domain-containing protein
LETALRVSRHQDELIRGYCIPRVGCDLHVWWAADSLPRPAPDLDWGRHTAGTAYAKGIVPGSHADIVRHPHLCEALKVLFAAGRGEFVSSDWPQMPRVEKISSNG